MSHVRAQWGALSLTLQDMAFGLDRSLGSTIPCTLKHSQCRNTMAPLEIYRTVLGRGLCSLSALLVVARFLLFLFNLHCHFRFNLFAIFSNKCSQSISQKITKIVS